TPSAANALRYFDDYVAQVTATTFFFEAFDEPWKANPQTDPQSVEPHFGLPTRGLGGSPLPAPEPSTLLMVLVGLGILRMAQSGMRGRQNARHPLPWMPRAGDAPRRS